MLSPFFSIFLANLSRLCTDPKRARIVAKSVNDLLMMSIQVVYRFPFDFNISAWLIEFLHKLISSKKVFISLPFSFSSASPSPFFPPLFSSPLPLLLSLLPLPLPFFGFLLPPFPSSLFYSPSFASLPLRSFASLPLFLLPFCLRPPGRSLW